jgi:hypothetical protein
MMARVKSQLKLINFDKLKDKLDPNKFDRRIKDAVRVATRAIAALAEAEVKREMEKTGAYAPNAPMTVAMKDSDRPLVATGELRKSITGQAVYWHTAMIGVLKRRVVRDPNTGEVSDLISIATILHNGATIPVSAAMRRLFFWLANSPRSPVQGKISPLGSRTSEIVIPGRPFLEPAAGKKMKRVAAARWSKAVQAALAGRRH